MNKIFLDNFYHPTQNVSVKNIDKPGGFNFIHGFYIDSDIKLVSEKILSDFLISLLMFDKLIIKEEDILELKDILGISDLQTILNHHIIEVAVDQGAVIILKEYEKSKYKLDYIMRATSSTDSTNWLEETLLKRSKTDKRAVNKLLYKIGEMSLKTDNAQIMSNVKEEIEYDLKNYNLITSQNLQSRSLDEIDIHDVYKILRLAHINRSLVYLNSFSANNVALEGGCKLLLNNKLSPIIKNHFKEDSVDVFREILDVKGIPDLVTLYKEKIISIEEIIELRENFDGKLFREWLASSDYNEKEILRRLLIKYNSRLNSRLINSIRWIVPNMLGIINPILGLSTSMIDSIIIKKILSGWNPSFFLDNLLMTKINDKIESYDRYLRQIDFQKKFGSVGRNDLCPCGSGKKFKKCCERKL